MASRNYFAGSAPNTAPKAVISPPEISIEIDVKNFLALLSRIGKTEPKRFVQAVALEAETVMTMSQAIVPVRWGILRGTAFVRYPKQTEAAAIIEVGYGGPAAPYAVAQHERDYKHKPPGQKKYLEEPFNYRRRGFDQRIAQIMQRGFK